MKKTKLVFICSRYRGDWERNIEKAQEYARFAALEGFSPIVPHLLFPQFLDDELEDERLLGIELGILQMKQCEEMWIFGGTISKGMHYEIDQAKKLPIRVRMYDEDLNRIRPEMLKIDDRVSELYRKTVYGLKFA